MALTQALLVLQQLQQLVVGAVGIPDHRRMAQMEVQVAVEVLMPLQLEEQVLLVKVLQEAQGKMQVLQQVAVAAEQGRLG